MFPDPVVEAAIAAHEAYPSKRLVAHFMQPHRPFVGEERLHFGVCTTQIGW